MSCKFFGEGNWSQSQVSPVSGGRGEKGEREVEICCIMKSAGYFSYIFHQLLIRSVANLKIIEHKTNVYEVIVSAEAKEVVFKLDIISYSFFHLPYDREMRNCYILLP